MSPLNVDTVSNISANSLAGKRVIVTGAAQGIGRVIACLLVSRGATVGVLDRNNTDETLSLAGQNSGRAISLHADVTNEKAVQSAVTQFVTETGGIDGLVNGAALFTTLERAPFNKIDLVEWEDTLSVNVTSVLLMTRAVSRYMQKQKQGSIVNISSNVVSYGAPNFLQYVTSKSALIGMTRSLARELGPAKVRVNNVSPGMVTTEITGHANSDEYRKGVIDTQIIKDAIQPIDVAELAAFLLGDASRFITGQNILINAGSHMGPA